MSPGCRGRIPFTMARFVMSLLCLPAAAAAQISPPRMVRMPDIHGDSVVFCAEGDVWLGSVAKGTAERLTTDPGEEARPKFSPDGRAIAFTASYEGGRDVYVMPTEGGMPRRLTFDPEGADMVCWTPDSKNVVFRSRRDSYVGPRLFQVPVGGGLPEALPMEKGAQASISPDGERMAYCPFPIEDHWWKRYHGGLANHIWIEDIAAHTFRRIDDSDVNEQYPAWAGGKLYFVTERDGSANLWVYDTANRTERRLTDHKGVDVKFASTDGKKVVYQFGDELWAYDIASGVDEELKLALRTDSLHSMPTTVPGKVGEWALGPTGARIAMVGRGQLFTAPAKEGDIRPISPSIASMTKQPAWSPDGKTLAFVSDRDGEENVYLAPTDGNGKARKLTSESKLVLGGLRWSPDGKRLLMEDVAQNLWIVDVATGAKTLVVHNAFQEVTDAVFSPDSNWVAFSQQENLFVQSLYLYNSQSKSLTRVTQSPTRDSIPAFDPDGKFLYFLSERKVEPKWDAFDFQLDVQDATKVMAVTLTKEGQSPFLIGSDEEPKKEDKEDAGKHDAKFRIDVDGLPDRVFELPLTEGAYKSLTAVPGGKVYYLAKDDLKAYSLSDKKETTITSGVASFQVSQDGKSVAVDKAGAISIAPVGSPMGDDAKKVDLSTWRVAVEPQKEWHEMFLQAWRNVRDTFYDPNTHGQDWNEVKTRYEALLPAVGSRGELNEILGQMIAELNVSHSFTGGGWTRLSDPPVPKVGFLGVTLKWDGGAYRIEHIDRGDGFDDSDRSPLASPGLGVSEGTYLLSIGRTALSQAHDPYESLDGMAGHVVTLTVNDKPSPEGARTIRVRAMESGRQAEYCDWVGRNRSYVSKASPNIGYVHIPDMGEEGMAEFSKWFYANLDKDGMVIDVRYNAGGITSGMVLERLRRVIFEYDQSRYGVPEPYHRMGFLGRVVVLCNEGTSSDGEYFCTGFRAMKLGKTIGTRTWGGFMAVGGVQLLDGGFVATPVEGSFAPDGKWLPDGYGFEPDYVVQDDPNAFRAGRDPQLDKAVSVVLDEIRQDPIKRPVRMAPPTDQKRFKGGG